MFASLSFAGMRGPPEIVAAATVRRRHSRDRRLRFGTILHLGCAVAAGAVTTGTLFAPAGYLLTRPADDTAARLRLDQRPAARVLAATPVAPADDATADPPKALAGTARMQAPPKPVIAVATSAPGVVASPLTPIDQDGKQKQPVNASATVVTGSVAQAEDAMTWTVGGQIVRLWGIRPRPRTAAAAFENFVTRVAAQGPLDCHRQAYSSRYRCRTAAGEDLGEMALSSGVAEALARASTAHRTAEKEARHTGRGLRVGR